MSVETREAVSTVLLAAAETIKSLGWCQHVGRDERGRVCMLNAILLNCGKIPCTDLLDAATKAVTESLIELYPRLAQTPTAPTGFTHGESIVIRFNDSVTTSIDDVTSILRHAALAREMSLKGDDSQWTFVTRY